MVEWSRDRLTGMEVTGSKPAVQTDRSTELCGIDEGAVKGPRVVGAPYGGDGVEGCDVDGQVWTGNGDEERSEWVGYKQEGDSIEDRW